MNLLALLVLLTSQNQEDYSNSYPENIEYCANIMHDPSMQQEFYKSCDLDQVNSYIMDTKRNWY